MSRTYKKAADVSAVRAMQTASNLFHMSRTGVFCTDATLETLTDMAFQAQDTKFLEEMATRRELPDTVRQKLRECAVTPVRQSFMQRSDLTDDEIREFYTSEKRATVLAYALSFPSLRARLCELGGAQEIEAVYLNKPSTTLAPVMLSFSENTDVLADALTRIDYDNMSWETSSYASSALTRLGTNVEPHTRLKLLSVPRLSISLALALVSVCNDLTSAELDVLVARLADLRSHGELTLARGMIGHLSMLDELTAEHAQRLIEIFPYLNDASSRYTIPTLKLVAAGFSPTTLSATIAQCADPSSLVGYLKAAQAADHPKVLTDVLANPLLDGQVRLEALEAAFKRHLLRYENLEELLDSEVMNTDQATPVADMVALYAPLEAMRLNFVAHISDPLTWALTGGIHELTSRISYICELDPAWVTHIPLPILRSNAVHLAATYLLDYISNHPNGQDRYWEATGELFNTFEGTLPQLLRAVELVLDC